MQYSLRRIDDIKEFKEKTVLVRVDTDVEVNQGEIIDDTRLMASSKTINYVLKKSGTVILVGHLGRPETTNSKLSLEPIARWFGRHYKGNVEEIKIGDFPGWKITDGIFLLENIRFYKEEEENKQEFAKRLASLGNIFVNEAFAVSHREHASVVGITKFLPSYAGFHLTEEVTTLSKVIGDPKRPLVVLIGGEKIETKLSLVERMHKIADYVLVGGEIAEQDKVLIKVQHQKIKGRKSIVLVAEVKEDRKDITEKSVENFIQVINIASTIVWNGPVGRISEKLKVKSEKFDINDSEWGTYQLAKSIAKANAYRVVGGGDTVAFLRRLDLIKSFDFVSTGGGAMLEFLSGKKLPGLVPLINNS